MQIKKILFPVDFSDSSLVAARYVEAFAGEFEAEIMLLRAVTMGEHTLAEELLPASKAELDAFLADELKYFTTHRVCVAGDPAAEIIENARVWNPDLVMMPTHGLGYFKRHLLGSTTASVLHQLECPVWTSVHADTVPALEDIHCRRILCAIDFTGSSLEAMKWAAWLAGEYQAELAVVHATPAVSAAVASISVTDEYQRYVSDEAGKRIDELAGQVGLPSGGKAPRVFINSGDPATVTASAAKDFGADLLVIGRHRQEGIAGDLLQKAYAILRESPCPVISV